MNLQEIIFAEVEKSTGPLDRAFFTEHIVLMRAIALDLAGALGADPAIVEAAAWLHDIAAVRDYTQVARHHLDGAAIARGILPTAGFTPEATARIAECTASR